jgi:hypothetical protein
MQQPVYGRALVNPAHLEVWAATMLCSQRCTIKTDARASRTHAQDVEGCTYCALPGEDWPAGFLAIVVRCRWGWSRQGLIDKPCLNLPQLLQELLCCWPCQSVMLKAGQQQLAQPRDGLGKPGQLWVRSAVAHLVCELGATQSEKGRPATKHVHDASTKSPDVCLRPKCT